MQEYLRETYFIDFNHQLIKDYLEDLDRSLPITEQCIYLYNKVRDGFAYFPYNMDVTRPAMKASYQVQQKTGYCTQKAILLTALFRAIFVPARLQFFIVRNHLGTGRLEKLLKTDKIVFHAGLQVYLKEKWIKLSPAFDSQICKKLKVATLNFNGKSDAIFQEFNSKDSSTYMEYLYDYGEFADFPYEFALKELVKHYPHVFDQSIPSNERKVFKYW